MKDYITNKENVEYLARKIQKKNPGFNVWVERTILGKYYFYSIESDIGFKGVKKYKIKEKSGSSR